MYDEAADVELHRGQLTTMDWHLDQAKVRIDWPRAWVCDVGGGGGLRAAMLTSRVARSFCADLIDQQARYGGEFVKLLAEKLARHGYRLAIDRFEANVTDATDLVYRANLFDFVCSVNAFEHIPDPCKALGEISRILKPGAFAYISFDPLWTADTGSHFSHRVPEPWAHLLCTDDEYARRMRDAAAEEWEIQEYRHAMNRVRLHEFESIFGDKARALGFGVRYVQRWSGVVADGNTEHPNFAAALEKFGRDELLTRGMAIVLEKLGPARA